MMDQPLFCEAQQAARRGDRAAAYRLFRRTLLEDPTNVSAWLEMSELVDDLARKIDCLERALTLDPSNQRTRETLEQLRSMQCMLVTPPIAASSERSVPPRKLGAHLVAQGAITADQLEEALWEQHQRRRRGEVVQIGTILLQRGWIKPRTLAQALVAQQQEQLTTPYHRPPRLLGEYLVLNGLITTQQLRAALETQARLRLKGRQVPLGLLLVRKRALSIEALQQTLMLQESDQITHLVG
jgi:hypothetical protein